MSQDETPSTSLKARAFEDVNIGDVYDTASVTITRAAIHDFAAQFDPQPMHLDENAAKRGFFGELVGSGWHAAVLTMRLVVDAHPFGSTPFIGMRVDAMRFKQPFRPGDELHVRAEVTAKRPLRDATRGYLTMQVTTYLADNSPLLTQQWTVLLPTRAATPQVPG